MRPFGKFLPILVRVALLGVVVYGAAWAFLFRDTYREVTVPVRVYQIAVVSIERGFDGLEQEGALPPPCKRLREFWDAVANDVNSEEPNFDRLDLLVGEEWVTVRCQESMTDRLKYWLPF